MTGPMRKMQNESVKSFDALASRPRFHTKQTTTHLLGNTQIVGARVSQNTTSKPNSAFDRTSRVLSAGHSCNIIVVQRSFWTGPHRHLSRPIFAVEQFPYTDGALFAVAPDALRLLIETQDPVQANILHDDLTDIGAPDRVTFTWPELSSSRIVAQQGQFSVGTNILASHDDAILEACSAVAAKQPQSFAYRKIIIASHLKLVILQQLRAMNVAPHALFPTVDGLGRSLSDLATLKVALANTLSRATPRHT